MKVPPKIAHARASATSAPETYWSSAPVRLGVADLFGGPALTERFGTDVGARLVLPVDAVPDTGAELWFVDPLVLADHGFDVGKYGLLTDAQEAALRDATILRRAKPGETPAHQVMATRYFDFADSVQGDGRAGVIGRPLLHRQGDRGHSALLRVKGIATGAAPVGQSVNDSHGHGRMDVGQAVHDAVHQLNDHLNGIDSPRSVAVAGTRDRFSFRGTSSGKTQTKTAGYLVECGRFDRAAHLLALLRKDDSGFVPATWSKAGVRRFLDDVGEQVRLELGRPSPLSLQGLFAHLNKKKAIEVADRYFMRTQQGSPTYDNIAFLQSIDHGTVQAQDRTHPHQGNSHTSAGFSGEPEQIFEQVVDTYFEFFSLAAERDERRSLSRWGRDDLRRKAIERPFERRMAHNAMMHLGLTESAAREVMRTHRDAAMAFGRLVREIGETPEPGAKHAIDRVEVENPARYDVFAALGAMMEARGTDAPTAHVAAALAALRPDAARDEATAKRLLDAAAPLLDAALGGADGDARAAKSAAIVDLAKRANAPSPHLYATKLNAWRDPLIAKIQKGEITKTRFRAEVQAYAR